MIVELEVGAQPTYDRKYRKPTWPGASSGVTIGIGYDVGYVSKAHFATDWTGDVLPDGMVAALQKAAGVTGAAARALAQRCAGRSTYRGRRL